MYMESRRMRKSIQIKPNGQKRNYNCMYQKEKLKKLFCSAEPRSIEELQVQGSTEDGGK